MVARADTSRLTPPASPSVAAAGAVVMGGLAATGCLVAPSALLESLVVRSGIAALVNAAAPPLGLTARLVLAITGGGMMAAVGWAVLVLVAGERRLPMTWPTTWPAIRRLALRRKPAPGGLAVRRADSHPDAPPRPPILAERDLGLPFLSIVAAPSAPPPGERALPADLDTPLAAIDPAAIPDVPREPVRPVAPLASLAEPPQPAPSPSTAPPLAPGERIESIELGADVRDRPDTIESLLARLERGARRLPIRIDGPGAGATPLRPEPRGGSLEETLGSLRRLATGG